MLHRPADSHAGGVAIVDDATGPLGTDIEEPLGIGVVVDGEETEGQCRFSGEQTLAQVLRCLIANDQCQWSEALFA